jgi:hypothetical protein
MKHLKLHIIHLPLTLSILVALIIGLATPYVAVADSTALLKTNPQIWAPADIKDKEGFGSSISLRGNLAAVGAAYANTPVDGAGAVYLFKQTETDWSEHTVLRAGDKHLNGYFGRSTDFDGSWLAVGSSGQNSSGVVYLFGETDGTWAQKSMIRPPESQKFIFFGSALGMDKGTLMVGAPGFDDGAEDTGLVMIYTLEDGSWVESGRLRPENPKAGRRLGTAIALQGDRALVGADSEAGGGAAYLYERIEGGWKQVARFSEEVGGSGGFGSAVVLDGDTLLIGAPFADSDEGKRTGAAFLYARDGKLWTRQATFLSGTSKSRDQFGVAVALRDDLALVSATRDDSDADDAGAVYAFTREGAEWKSNGRLLRPGAEAYDEFGGVLSLEAGILMVGTPQDAAPSTRGSYTGTVTSYEW